MVQTSKFAVFAFACYFIYKQIVTTDFQLKFSQVKDDLLSTAGIFLLLLVFLLQFLNYSLEAVKWNQLVKLQHDISLKVLIKAVYVGNSISIFTPNRVGSYLGRMIVLKEYPKLFVTASSFLGNLAQLTITVLFGVIGFVFFTEEVFFTHNYWFLIFFSVLTLLFIAVLFKSKWFITLFYRYKWFGKYREGVDFLEHVASITIFKVLFFAFLRYTVFVLEFWLVLLACGFSISFPETLVFCGVVYAVSNFIPSPMMGNLGTREMVVLLVFGAYGLGAKALTASLLIWLINVAFPSILGAIWLNFKTVKTTDNAAI